MRRLAPLLVLLAIAGIAWLAVGRARPGPSLPPPDPRGFVDVAVEAGIDLHCYAGSPTKEWLVDLNGAGLAWIDYDRDGDPDLFVVGNFRVGDTPLSRVGVQDRLYRNEGDGTFREVTDEALPKDAATGTGVATGDYDNDGWMDILVANHGPDTLLRNLGNGRFEDVSARAGLAGVDGWSTSAAFLDADNDGDLDIFVARYAWFDLVKFHPDTECPKWMGLFEIACGPGGFIAEQDVLWRNEGDGTFTDVSKEAGIRVKKAFYSMGALTLDADGDGWQDIYVPADALPNAYFHNLGNGKFEEVALAVGLAYNESGQSEAGMGIDSGDVNGDGLPDIFVTNFAHQTNVLYLNRGTHFEDGTAPAGIKTTTFDRMGWGAVLADLDNDADLDIFFLNGHTYPQVDGGDEETYAQLNQLLLNDGRGVFQDVSADWGPAMAVTNVGRGLAAADYDNDGDLDLAVTTQDAPLRLLRNDRARRGNWLSIELEGTTSHRSAFGAKVLITAGGKTQVRWVKTVQSFQSAGDPRLHIGLGNATEVETLEVLWPSGRRDVYSEVEANRSIHIREGEETVSLAGARP